MKFEIIENGRLDKESMNVILGGNKWENCSDSGTACPKVSGTGFVVIRDCAHNYYSCDSGMVFCVSDDELSQCGIIQEEAKFVKRPR